MTLSFWGVGETRGTKPRVPENKKERKNETIADAEFRNCPYRARHDRKPELVLSLSLCSSLVKRRKKKKREKQAVAV